jgi:hypothetical protein
MIALVSQLGKKNKNYRGIYLENKEPVEAWELTSSQEIYKLTMMCMGMCYSDIARRIQLSVVSIQTCTILSLNFGLNNNIY